MYTIKDYMLIETSNLPELFREVKTQLKKGWQPLGGVQFGYAPAVSSPTKGVWVQTMVRYELNIF